jgi:hypothetical protein
VLNPLKTVGSRSSSLVRATWHSLHSWTQWPQQRSLRRAQEQEAMLRRLLEVTLAAMDQALEPLEQALVTIEDSQDRDRDTVNLCRELLLEVLSSLQPTAQEQIFRELGQPPLPISPPGSES